MSKADTVVAIFTRHEDAESAVRKLAEAGFDMKRFSIVGRGYHSEERVVGFYNTGDRVRFWGANGAFWGGLWGLFMGGMMFTIPLIGHVMVLGYLASTVFSVVEGAAIGAGLTALGAALFSIGIPKDSIVRYEEELKADRVLIVAHGASAELGQVKTILETSNPRQVDVHEHAMNQSSADHAKRPSSDDASGRSDFA